MPDLCNIKYHWLYGNAKYPRQALEREGVADVLAMELRQCKSDLKF
jgi:hypothetical protein